MGCIIHKWNGCTCTKCGKIRDINHEFVWINGIECTEVCTICNAQRSSLPHEWKYVPAECIDRCIRCRGTRIHHDYQPVEGQCKLRCSVCGKEKPIEHSFVGNYCLQTCTVCGYQRTVHKWNTIGHGKNARPGCTCTICRKLNPAGRHDWKYLTGGNYTNIKVCAQCGKRDESSKITLAKAKYLRAENERAMDRAMEKNDSIHEMGAKGFKNRKTK